VQSRQQLAVAAGPRLVALARKRGVDLLDYLFPLFDLPAGDGPEAALLLAVMRQESGFSHKAVNPSGATGIMQLMPDTAQQFADKLKLGWDEEKLLDPDFNVTLGRAYLDHLIRYYNGSYILALAAYNAGPARVSEWIKRFGDPRISPDDPMVWVDSLPFRETRRYVNAVMCSLQVYRYRLVEPGPEQGPRPPAIRSAALEP
jgi:soluble lytic murein transglycosylase